MKLCFMGASGLGLRCLQLVHRLPAVEVVGAITAPRSFAISYRPQGVTNVLHADVKQYCDDNAIECAVIDAGMKDPALLQKVRNWSPSLFLVAGWYHMVPASWRELAPAYGLHASLLPDYSGGAPLVWAMINGEKSTGITLFRLADGVDNGPILGQARTAIDARDTIATLYSRIEELGLELIGRHLPELANGTAVLTEQDESRRRVFPQRGPEDGVIDWRQPSYRVHDFVRAQTKPYPGAFTVVEAGKLTIWSSRDLGATTAHLEPGELRSIEGELVAGCAEGTALVLQDVAMGGVDMTARDWWRGRADASG